MTWGIVSRRIGNASALCIVAAISVAVLLIAAAGAGAALEPSAAITVGATVPVLDHDVSQAHQQALSLSFRRAVSAGLAALGARPGAGERALENPERYVLAFRIQEQTRRDLFYRLQLLVWLDRRLLREEAAGPRGNR